MESNVVEMIEPAPDGFNISREAWAQTPAIIRAETIRMHCEMAEGIAILKDRRAGRIKRVVPGMPAFGSKRVPGGWWELHCCERDGNQARAAELRELLAPEAARMAENDNLVEYHEMAEQAGKKLPDVLRNYIAMENLLRHDFDSGLAVIARNAGIDLIDFATVKAAGVHLAHGMLMKKAAAAIRQQPHKNWDGLHFGFMADEVERVRPDCVVMQPNGFRAVDYGRLSTTPEMRSLPVYTYRYKDGGMGEVA